MTVAPAQTKARSAGVPSAIACDNASMRLMPAALGVKVFVHSWDEHFSPLIHSMLRPENALFEPQMRWPKAEHLRQYAATAAINVAEPLKIA